MQGKDVADAVKAVRGGKQVGYRPSSVRTTQRVCFYCLDTGHLIADCEAWIKKYPGKTTKSVAFVKSVPTLPAEPMKSSLFEPFLLTGSVALSDVQYVSQ